MVQEFFGIKKEDIDVEGKTCMGRHIVEAEYFK